MGHTTHILTQIFLPFALVMIMLSMGLGLKVSDFKSIILQPKAFFVGFIAHLIILPTLAFCILHFSSIRPEFAVGLIIIAACPEAIVSNFISHKSRGDVALSIALTAVISLVSVFSIPLIVGYALRYYMGSDVSLPMSAAQMSMSLMTITVIPVSLGMATRHFKPAFALMIQPYMEKIAGIFFVGILLGALAAGHRILTDHFAELGLLTMALNLGAMLSALLVVRLFRLNARQSISIILECGLQSGAQAIFIAVTLLKNETMMIPGAVYGILMYASAFIVMVSARKMIKVSL